MQADRATGSFPCASLPYPRFYLQRPLSLRSLCFLQIPALLFSSRAPAADSARVRGARAALEARKVDYGSRA
jgi:hypothetical protein